MLNVLKFFKDRISPNFLTWLVVCISYFFISGFINEDAKIEFPDISVVYKFYDPWFVLLFPVAAGVLYILIDSVASACAGIVEMAVYFRDSCKKY